VEDPKAPKVESTTTCWESRFEATKRLTFDEIIEVMNKNLNFFEDPTSYATLAGLIRDPFIGVRKLPERSFVE
jgi:hypothetical protein